MLLSVSPTQTTLYDQIRYSGNPTSFAWVLPIRGQVTVGLSADILFDAVDSLTQTDIHAPPLDCPQPPSSCTNSGGGCGSSSVTSADFASASPNGGVTVTKQQNVGPYETVQLHATDASAINNWLSTNGFVIPAEVTPILDAYVGEGFDFLAMKLLPNEGIQAMRPVRVSMPGSSLSLPLRMASVGTGVTVGITIWVVSDGRYEPQNFPFFHIDDSQLIWDVKASASNYTTLRASTEATFGGRGWEIESSINLNETLINGAISSGGTYVGAPYGGAQGTATADDDYLPVTSGDAGTVTESAQQVRNDDLQALFAGLPGPTVRVTRMRSDVAHTAMTADLHLQAATDQAELSNVRNVTQVVNLQCPIYDNCAVVGYGTLAQANASVSGHGGCVASTQTRGGPTAPLVVLGGALGLVARRLVRRRSISRSSKRT
jgi:hypothetical protein